MQTTRLHANVESLGDASNFAVARVFQCSFGKLRIPFLPKQQRSPASYPSVLFNPWPGVVPSRVRTAQAPNKAKGSPKQAEATNTFARVLLKGVESLASATPSNSFDECFRMFRFVLIEQISRSFCQLAWKIDGLPRSEGFPF